MRTKIEDEACKRAFATLATVTSTDLRDEGIETYQVRMTAAQQAEEMRLLQAELAVEEAERQRLSV